MNAILAERIAASNGLAARSANNDRNPIGGIGALFCDGLDDIVEDDEVVVTTRRAVGRAVGRAVLVAGEASGRFQQEGVGHDPMSWMFAPRRVFDGAAAIDACRDGDSCVRNILVHGSDVDRSALDALLASGGEDYHFDEREFNYLYGGGTGSSSQSGRRASDRSTGMRLFTAKIAENRGDSMLQAFKVSEARPRRHLFAREQVGRSLVVTLTGVAAWKGVRMSTFRVSRSLPFEEATVRDVLFGWLATRFHRSQDSGGLTCCKESQALTQLVVGPTQAVQTLGGAA